LLPANCSNGYPIVQTPTHGVIIAERIHEARIIPLHAKTHGDARAQENQARN
jgi:hypothetical protein